MTRYVLWGILLTKECNMDYTELEKLILQVKVGELGSDIHKETAAKMYNKPVDEVTDEERKAAKNRNFLLMYNR